MRTYELLELRYPFGAFCQVLHPVVLFGETDTVLVDCGYPGSLEMLEAQLTAHGIAPETVTQLLLTHQDDDHIGAAAEWLERYPGTQILASALEAPYLEGQETNLRLAQAERMQPLLPEAEKAGGEQFLARYRALRPVPVARRLREGDVFDWCGGCVILETPGHTPGHISILAQDGSFVVTGDAAVVEAGTLAVANPGFCLDLPEAERSLTRLLSLSCPVYLCCHGGAFFRENAANPTPAFP